MPDSAEPTRLRQSLRRLLEAGPREDDKILAVAEKRSRSGQPFYSAALHVLTHLSFTEAQARRHWEAIRLLRRDATRQLGRDPGLRVAMLDYFVNFNHELKSPKVVEIAIFERTERQALTDGLTGLFNRAYFVQALRREVYRARRHGLKLSMGLLDLDDFKRINDTRGHVEGDRALVKTAALVSGSLRDMDVSARYGGEEFAVILPDTDRQGAFVVAERIRARIEDQFRRRRGAAVTISGGVVTFPDDGLDPAELVAEADRLLYCSKADGKNRITLTDPNRRRYERHPLHHPIEISTAPRRVIGGVTRNISEGGMLVAAPESVPVGSRVAIMLRPSSESVVSLRGQVVRADPHDDDGLGAFDLGVRLLSDPRRNRVLAQLWQGARAGNA